MNNPEYEREYNLNFTYKVPYNKFSKSYILRWYVNEIASVRFVTVEDVIDTYVYLGIDGLSDSITKMIKHDGVCNRKNLNCIIDYPKNYKVMRTVVENRLNESNKQNIEKRI